MEKQTFLIVKCNIKNNNNYIAGVAALVIHLFSFAFSKMSLWSLERANSGICLLLVRPRRFNGSDEFAKVILVGQDQRAEPGRI